MICDTRSESDVATLGEYFATMTKSAAQVSRPLRDIDALTLCLAEALTAISELTAQVAQLEHRLAAQETTHPN
jgi:hypothetical protein